jgi:enoyl-CoA hydratase
MSTETIVIETRGRVGVIRLNRLQALNALNARLKDELLAAAEAFDADAGIGCIVITGSDKAFAAGADIKEMADKSYIDIFSADYAADYERLTRVRKPIIAAVAGFALGGGCELAMSCDIRIAADSARLGQPEINLGIIPGMGGTQRLPRLVGKGWAKYLDLTADFIDAETALRIGLVEKVVPAAELMNAAKELANKLATKAPLAVAAIKKAINDGMEVDLDRGLAIEAAQFAITASTEDRVEGTSAFLEKRKPEWKGR